jgi:hypothetical protein
MDKIISFRIFIAEIIPDYWTSGKYLISDFITGLGFPEELNGYLIYTKEA